MKWTVQFYSVQFAVLTYAYLWNHYCSWESAHVYHSHNFPSAPLSFCPAPLCLTPSQATSVLVSVIIHKFAFLRFRINGIIQYVLSFAWILSFSMIILKFIHVIAFINSLFLFYCGKVLHDIAIPWYYLTIHFLMNIWVVSSVWLLQIKL